MIAIIAGVVGTCLTVYMVLPQASRIWRDKSSIGVSTASWSLFALSFSLWVGYDIRVGNPVNLICNVLTLMGATVILAGIANFSGRPRPRQVFLLAFLLVGCVAACFFGLLGFSAVVGALLLAGMGWRVPQLLRSLKTYRIHGRSEVSITSWWLGLASSSCWLVHGLFRPDIFIALGSCSSVLLASGILILEYATIRSRRRASAPKAPHQA